MHYRDKFYSKYVSALDSHLYGEVNLPKIRKQFPAWQKYFGKFLPKNKNAKIIELGCGKGGFIYWLQQSGYSNVEGIDISIEQIEDARKLGIKNIHQADLKEFLKTKQDFYDVIFMRDVLEHFTKEGVLDVLELIYQSLRNNGVFITQTSNAESPFSGRFRYGDFTHEISFTEYSIRQILLVSGFREVVIHGTQPVIHGVKSLIRFVLWKIIEAGLRFYLLVESGSGKGIFAQNLIIKAEK